MALTVDPAKILTEPGRIIWDPTTLDPGVDPDFGGKVLGLTEDGFHIEPGMARRVTQGEELGDEAVKVAYMGTSMTCFATLLEWKDDTLERAFPGGLTAVGPVTGERFVQFPGTDEIGRDIPTGKLLFVPDDDAVNKVFLAFKVKALLAEGARISKRLRDDTKLELVFHCQRDDAISKAATRFPYRLAAIADRRDLTLTL